MRNALLTLAALLFTVPSASAQSPEWADKLFAKEGTSHNFGTVPHGAVMKHRFPITNIYAVPLQVMSSRVSCGCVTVVPAQSVLQPKESSYVDVTMDARRFTGHKVVSIYVTVGPQYVSTATLQVSAQSRADVVLNPGELNFGVVSAGQGPTQAIDIEYAGVLDWRITGLVEPNQPISTRLEEVYRRPGQVGYRLHVTIKPDAAAGSYNFEQLLRTNDPASPLLPVQVDFTVQAPLAVVPGKVHLGTVGAGQESTRRVVVRGSKPFRILGVEGMGDGLDIEFPDSPNMVQVVTIRWKPSKGGELRRDLRVKSDLDGGAVATVTVEGSANP
jgi:hypothetical protein